MARRRTITPPGTTIFVDVTCDRCPARLSTDHGFQINSRLAQRKAVELGWERVDGDDLCPSCNPNREAAPAELPVSQRAKDQP